MAFECIRDHVNDIKSKHVNPRKQRYPVYPDLCTPLMENWPHLILEYPKEKDQLWSPASLERARIIKSLHGKYQQAIGKSRDWAITVYRRRERTFMVAFTDDTTACLAALVVRHDPRVKITYVKSEQVKHGRKSV